MPNHEPLFWYGIAVLIICGLCIIVPYLRGRSEILTGWNTLLLGIAIYIGLGCLETKYVPNLAWESLSWFQPTPKEVQWYILASTAFIATLLLAYYYNTPAKNFAQRRLQKWPEINPTVILFVLGFCFVTVISSFLVMGMTFFGPLTSNLAHKAAVFACVFSFYLWYRSRLNIVWMALFIGVFLVAGLYSMVVFSGRRLLLSILLAPILCIYWMTVRHWKPAKTLTAIGVATALILVASLLYSTFRWFNVSSKEERTAAAIVEQIRNIGTRKNALGNMLSNRLSYFAQSNVHMSLLTQRYVAQGQLVPVPLNSLRFILTYPIPRRVWSNKPDVVGLKITRDLVKIKTNWGVGVPGHGAYEGGILALMLYAVLLAFAARCIDEPLSMQPDNPFLIALHAAALPHVVAIPRGDMGSMFTETAECFLFAIILGIGCRMLFGTRRAAMPSAASAYNRRYWPSATPHA